MEGDGGFWASWCVPFLWALGTLRIMSYFFPGLLFIASSEQIYECVTCLKVVFSLTKEQTYPVSVLSNYGKMFKGKRCLWLYPRTLINRKIHIKRTLMNFQALILTLLEVWKIRPTDWKWRVQLCYMAGSSRSPMFSDVKDNIYCCCCYCCLVTESCLTLWDSLDYSPPGSSVYGISQARILEWVAMSFYRGSFQLRD